MISKYEKIFVLYYFQTIKMELSIKDTSISCTFLSNQLNLTNSSLKDEDKINTCLLKEAAVTKAKQATSLFQKAKDYKLRGMWEGLFPLYPETENPVSLSSSQNDDQLNTF